jgi:hypothetical protein
MAAQVLVPMARSDNVEQLLPYIEQVAEPGLKVIFLIHRRLSGFKELADQLLFIHSGVAPEFLPTSNNRSVSEERTAEEQLLRPCQVLQKKGVEVGISVYTGSLSGAVREYTQKHKDQAPLIIVRPASGNRLTTFLQKIPLYRLVREFNPQAPPPVLLFHLSRGMSR